MKIEEPKEEEIKPETETVDKKVTTEPPKYVLQKLPTSADKRQPIATPAPSKLIDCFYFIFNKILFIIILRNYAT